jgi:hypothetical protein
MHGLETIRKLNKKPAADRAETVSTNHSSPSEHWEDALRRDWARVGTEERGRTASCGVCGCRSNLWETVGNTMIGIKTILVCPAKSREPQLHERIAGKQGLLYDDNLPASAQKELVLELKALRAEIQRVGNDIL